MSEIAYVHHFVHPTRTPLKLGAQLQIFMSYCKVTIEAAFLET
jgi:hypothetical protein